MIGLKFRDVLSGSSPFVVEELDNITAALSGLWGVQHRQDGSHGHVTADALTALGAVSGVTGSFQTLHAGTFTADSFVASGSGLPARGAATDLVWVDSVGALRRGTLVRTDLPASFVESDQNETITGGWTFSSPITGSISGNAGTATLAMAATKLATARTIWGQSFDGTGNVSGAFSGATTGAFSGLLSANGGITLGADLLPNATYARNLGSLPMKLGQIHAGELWIGTIVQQDTHATVGGRVLVGPTTTFAADAAPGEAQITVKHPLALGSILYAEVAGNVEFIRVDTLASGLTYNVTRAYGGAFTAKQWRAGDALFNTGAAAGAGFIDLYSTRGVKASSEIGPAIVGNVRTGAGFAEWAPRWVIGNLRGLYGYTGDTYGAAFGDASATHVTVDADNGFRVRYGGANKLHADTAGNLSLTGNLTSDHVTIDGTGIRIDAGDSGYYYTRENGYRFDASSVGASDHFGTFAGTALVNGEYDHYLTLRSRIATSRINRVSMEAVRTNYPATSSWINLEVNNAGNAGMQFGVSGDAVSAYVMDMGPSGLYLKAGAVLPVIFSVLSGGNVGIGTASPGYKLTISGGDVDIGGGKLRMSAAGVGVYWDETWGWRYVSDGTHPLRLSGTSLVIGYESLGTNFGSGNLFVSGNVGIGTINPVAPLTVQGAGSFNHTTGSHTLRALSTTGLDLHLRAAQGKHNYISFTENAVADRWVIKSPAGSGSLIFATGSPGSETDRVTIDSVGNVGIGGAASGEKFRLINVVAGTADRRLALVVDGFNGGANGYYFAILGGNGGINLVADWNNLSFGARADGTIGWKQTLTVATTDRVGIGTTAPTNKLHVDGTNPVRFVGMTGASTGAYVRTDGNGVFYWDSSLRKYKRNVRDFVPPPERGGFSRILDVPLHEYEDATTGEMAIGVIAEELEELGLGYLVGYHEGRAWTVHYERIALYLLGLLREVLPQLSARLGALERGRGNDR